MRIAVVQHVGAGNYSDYISSLIDEAAVKLNYQIKTWSNSIPAFKQQIPDNAIVYILIESTGRFTLKWWYVIKLKSIFKKLKADVVIDLNGVSVSKQIAQFVIADQTLLNENRKAANDINTFAFTQLKQTIHSADCIITYAEQKAAALHNNKANVQVIRFAAPDNFRKYEWHEKIMIKAMHADNNDYFISVLNDDAEDDFVVLLRGFSVFKKWQQSSMKLLLLPKHEAFTETIHEKLKKYKHRNDVNLLEQLDETALVAAFASAHSLIHFTSGDADLLTLSIALKCALPVISFKDAEAEEYLSNAAYYTQDKSSEALGNALINLYKDEQLQTQLKDAAEKQSSFFDRNNYSSRLWQLLETAAHS